MALSLMFKDVISVFNGKNMKGMFIPIMKSSSDVKVNKAKSKVEKVKAEKGNRVIFPQYHTDVLVELKDIRYSLDDELSIYKKGEVGQIISDITGQSLPVGWWTIERVREDALKYTTRHQWNVLSGGAYMAASRFGILEECCSHMEIKMKPQGHWSEERIIEESAKYSCPAEWQKGAPGSYNAARRLGIYDKCCELSYSMKKLVRKTNDDILAISKKYTNVKEWKADDINSYKSAHKRGILAQCVEHMPKRGVLKRKWTFDLLKKDIGDSTKTEWRKANKAGYRSAFRAGWLNDLFK